MNVTFPDLVEYYDDFQAKLFDYAMEAKIVDDVFRKNLVKKAVDVGCGTGTHLIDLAKIGYECIGIDNNKEMLKKAREKAIVAGVDIKFIKADIRDSKSLKEWYGKLDASIWIRNTLTSVDDIKKALKTQYDLLSDKGIIIFDLLRANEDICEDEILNMDIIKKNNITIVRINDFKIKRSEVHYHCVYFIQFKNKERIIPNKLVLPLICKDDITKILSNLGFKYGSVINEYIGIPKTKATMIYARKRGTNDE